MDKDRLVHLIKKIITGSASEKEEAQVNENLFESFSGAEWSEEEMGEKEKVRTRLLENVKENIIPVQHEGRIIPLIIRLGKVAAVVAIFLLIGFYSLRSLTSENDDLLASSSQKLMPGKEIASLELDDGTVLNLDDLSIGETFENPDFKVMKTEEGNLEYHYLRNSNTEASEEEWNTLRTPKGGKFQIILADGTKVWLNAESSLTFPKSFASTLRNVSVTGEVYFEVSHDEDKPFLVNTKEMDIHVLGTSFNVTAYENDLTPSVSLVEGSVQVKTRTGLSKIVPGEQARVQNDRIEVENFDLESALAWKNDYFIFKNKNIKEIMTELGRWYDADIEYQGEGWENKNFNIRMSRRESIAEVLSIIELTETIKFKITGRRILVVT